MRGRCIVSSILFQESCEVVPEDSGTKIQCLHIGKRGNAEQQLNVTGHHGKNRRVCRFDSERFAAGSKQACMPAKLSHTGRFCESPPLAINSFEPGIHMSVCVCVCVCVCGELSWYAAARLEKTADAAITTGSVTETGVCNTDSLVGAGFGPWAQTTPIKAQ